MTEARCDWAAVIVAAGRGERFGRAKQLFELAGLPMAGWSIRAFAEMPEIAHIVVVTESAWLDAMRELCAATAATRATSVVEGGATRQISVRNGLRAVPDSCGAVLVHDGARPLVRAADVRAAMLEVREGRAALLASQIVDTIKVVDAVSRRVLATLDRETLWAAQTPQFALMSDLRRAHDYAQRERIAATDDAALLERIGVEVVVVPGSQENFKITLPEDVVRAQALLRERALPATPQS